MGNKVIDIHTRLPQISRTELELDVTKARAHDSNKKYEYYVMQYEVVRLNKKDNSVDSLGSIKYVGSTLRSVVKMIVNEYEVIILDGKNLFRLDLNDALYLVIDEEYA